MLIKINSFKNVKIPQRNIKAWYINLYGISRIRKSFLPNGNPNKKNYN